MDGVGRFGGVSGKLRGDGVGEIRGDEVGE